MDYKNADKKALKENLKNKIHGLLTEGVFDEMLPNTEYSAQQGGSTGENSGASNTPQDQQIIQQIDQIDHTQYPNAIAILKKAVETSNGNNNQAFRIALLKEFEQLGGSNITVNMNASVSVANLRPTQNIIAADGSLGWILYKHPEQIKSNVDNAFAGDVMINNTPIITCGNYVVDGHHRWSQVYLLNPNATMKAIDLGLQTSDKTQILKLVQIAIANSQLGNGGHLPLSNAEGGINLLGSASQAKQSMISYIKNAPSLQQFVQALYPHLNTGAQLNEDYGQQPAQQPVQQPVQQQPAQQPVQQPVQQPSQEEIAVLEYCGNNAASIAQRGSVSDPDRSLMPQTDKAAGGLQGTTSSLANLANDAKSDANNSTGQQMQENKNSKKKNSIKLTESQFIQLIRESAIKVIKEIGNRGK